LRSIFRKSLALLMPGERKAFFTGVALNLVISIIDVIFLAALVILIGFYSGYGIPRSFHFIPSAALTRDSLVPVTAFLLLFAAKNLAGYFIVQFQCRSVYTAAVRISQTNLQQYFEGSYLNYVSRDSSVNLRRIGQIPNEFCQHVLAGFQQMISQFFLVSLTTVAILLYNPGLFCLLFLLLMPPVILISYLLKSRLKAARAEIKRSGEESMQYLKEALASYVESNVDNKKSFFVKRYIRVKKQLNHFLAEVQVAQGISSRMIEVFAVLGFAILIAINKFSGKGVVIEVVTISAFMAAAYKIIPGIIKILSINGQIKTYAFTVGELSAPAITAESTYSKEVIESIEFKNVSFSYNDIELLSGQNLKWNKGDFIGISGNSGMGKTTLVNLLLGFLDPTCGEIRFNNEIADQVKRRSFWNKTAYAKQQAFLLHNTIQTNISFSETSIDQGRLKKAAAASGVDSITAELTETLGKTIAENGRNISGGQQQRITIARAFYKEADLLILDEPFNEMDDQSGEQILAYCRELAEQGKIIVLITHNKKNFSYCNKMVVLNEQ
jgi:ABC-type multidrug transport system fused ATPase/permease subunit